MIKPLVSRQFLTVSLSLVLYAGVSAVTIAKAQEPEIRIDDNDAVDILLDPITVSVDGENEGSATIFTEEEIENQRLYTLEDVLRATPGVNISSSGGTNLSTIYIRGVGSMYPMGMDDSMSTLTINGSPLNARHISLNTLDVERVEILKGPQGTRSGASASAGIINIVTQKPTDELEGYVHVEYGQENQRLVESAVGGPLLENLSGRIAVRYMGSDHWVTNETTGNPVSDPSELAIRGSLLWESENTEALFTIEHQTVDDLPNLIVLHPFGSHPAVELPPDLYDDVSKEVDRVALELSHNLGPAYLNLATSYVHSENTEVAAYDKNLYNALYGYPSWFWNVDEAEESVFYQDISLSSPDDAPFEWRFGAMIESNDGSYDTPENTYGTSSAIYRDFDSLEYAIYGEVTYPVTTDLRVTAGLRQSWIETSYAAEFTASGTSDHRDLSESFTSGRLNLSYDVAPTTELHATYARGFTPGGFNIYSTQVADGEPYRGAVTDMIELGFDAETVDGAFAVSGAVYANWVKDNHLLSYDSFTYVVSALNADTRSYGAELSASWQPVTGLSLIAGLSYVDAEITSDVLGVGDGDILAGNKVPDVAPWSANLAATYSRPLPEWHGVDNAVLNASINYSYVGARPADPQNHFDLEAYHKLDARIGIEFGGGEFYVAGQNLLDQQYDLYGYYAPAADVSYGAMVRGRTFLTGLSYRF